ncbi:MAG: hypothetical protein M9932_16135 [Xanthobacteraceae bacterium]|nr:hypothetical protein [Xanthobacteraceae bacterium]
MTTQQLSAFLDGFERAAHEASATEENYQREAAARLKQLAEARAFGFRRLNLMRTVAAAIQDCGTEDDAIVRGSTAFLHEVGWSTENESQQEALEKFQPVIRACWQIKQAEAETDSAANPDDVGKQLSEFEDWFGTARNGPFLSVLEREIVELPLVEPC